MELPRAESTKQSEPGAVSATDLGAGPRSPGMASSPAEDVAEELTYSVRLARPFLRVLRRSGAVAAEVVAEFESMDTDSRLPMTAAHQMLLAAVQQSGDDTIGLKAARESSPGEAGVLDHAISSASTVRDALDAASRYMGLVNEALDLRLEALGREALLRLDHRVPLPRVALEFELGAIFQAFRSVWAAGVRDSVRVLAGHEPPADLTEYAHTFDGAPIEFRAECYGFAFDAACLDAPLASSESRLHEVILQHAEKMLEELPRKRSLADRVKSAIAAELEAGRSTVAHVAHRFHMSPRTLERKLDREGTTFSALLEDVRKSLALRYVARRDLELTEIAFLLGYSQTTAFHRAFKRWTGETPIAYRRARR